MTSCPACGVPFRKGRRRYMLQPDGQILPRLVCTKCALGRSIQIVTQTRRSPCVTCKPGEAHDATVCAGCSNAQAHNAVRKALEPFAEHFRNLAAVYRKTGHPSAVGLAQAADILDEARAVNVIGSPGPAAAEAEAPS
jgi:hypothetical protein